MASHKPVTGRGLLPALVSTLFHLPGPSNTCLLPALCWAPCAVIGFRRRSAESTVSLLRVCHGTDPAQLRLQYCVWDTDRQTDRQTAIQNLKGRWGPKCQESKKGVLRGWLCWLTWPILRELELLLTFYPVFRIFLNVSASFYTYSLVFKNSSKMLWVLQE